MNGIHDMGGMHGMGPVVYEKNEPVFHAPWEARVYVMRRAMGAWRKWVTDHARHEVELIPPADYMRMSYYERWLVSTIELEAPDRPYTFETVERLRSAFGMGTRLFFVMGADSFEENNARREPARLLSSTSLIVITRPGHDVGSSHLDERFRSTIVDLRGREGELQLDEGVSEHHIYLTGYVNTGVSSTEIRQRVRDGESIEDMVPARVADYIRKYELYRR